jgi:hypothetical protein
MILYNADVPTKNEASGYILIHAEGGMKQQRKFLYVRTTVSIGLPVLFCVNCYIFVLMMQLFCLLKHRFGAT